MRASLFITVIVLSQWACVPDEEDVNATADAADEISSEFAYTKEKISVLGSEMAYVDVGQGPVVLFVHGNPTSSYIWRNVIPHLSDKHRVIAVDLIGMGDSAKPRIEYTFDQHAEYLDSFVQQLGLNDIVLVGHDWGTVLVMRYARIHPDKVKAVAFMEALVPPVVPAPNYASWGDAGDLMKNLQAEGTGEKMVVDENFFIDTILARTGAIRGLTEEEMDVYRRPFVDPLDRTPMLAWAREVPFDDRPTSATDDLIANGDWLTASATAKLLLYADPGAMTTSDTVEYFQKNASNLQTKFVGKGNHFLQEDVPNEIGDALDAWLATL